MKRYVLLIGLIFAVVTIVGCEATDEDKPSYDELIKTGKKYLEKQDAVPAAEAFDAALEIRPSSSEAKYGLFLANIMQVGNLFSNLLDLISEAEGLESFGESGTPLGTYIQEFLQKILEPKLNKNEQIYLELLADPNLLFTLKSYRLTLGDDILLNWHGRFKQPELHLLAAVNALILAADHIVCAHYLDFDIARLGEIPPLPEDLSDLGAVVDALGAILEIIEDLMYDPNYPDFLYLKGEEGAVRMPAAGLLLGATWFRIMESFSLASNQPGSRNDDPITYEDWDSNGTRNPEEPLIIHGIPLLAGLIDDLEGVPPEQRTEDVKLSGELVTILTDLFGIFGVSFLDTTSYDLFPEEPNPITLGDFNPILVYFGVVPFPIPFIDMIKFYPGPWFAQPAPDGMRQLIESIIKIYDIISEFF